MLLTPRVCPTAADVCGDRMSIPRDINRNSSQGCAPPASAFIVSVGRLPIICPMYQLAVRATAKGAAGAHANDLMASS